MSDWTATPRWDPYILARNDEFSDFWRTHLCRRRRLLLVMGRGFDNRALETSRRLSALGAQPDIWLLAYDNGLDDSPDRVARTERNCAGLIELFGAARLQSVPIDISGQAVSTATSRRTIAAIEAAGRLDDYDDVIIDISAMPRMVALTTIVKLLRVLDQKAAAGGKPINMHVTVAESVAADVGATRGTLHEEVTHVQGFSGRLKAEADELVPRVWFPVLGEGQHARLEAIRTHINPDEICPVVPFPTREPRRGDKLLEEHRVILFEDFQVEPKNILIASEYNPFEAYKQMFDAMDQYRKALKELGGGKAFVSPLSSKLLSVGALLAAYDHLHGDVQGDRLSVGIPYVETAVYGDPQQPDDGSSELHSMWIRGEWEL